MNEWMERIGNIRRNFMSKSIDKIKCLSFLENCVDVGSLGVERLGWGGGGRRWVRDLGNMSINSGGWWVFWRVRGFEVLFVGLICGIFKFLN